MCSSYPFVSLTATTKIWIWKFNFGSELVFFFGGGEGGGSIIIYFWALPFKPLITNVKVLTINYIWLFCLFLCLINCSSRLWVCPCFIDLFIFQYITLVLRSHLLVKVIVLTYWRCPRVSHIYSKVKMYKWTYIWN